jgi:hypothetical protein
VPSPSPSDDSDAESPAVSAATTSGDSNARQLVRLLPSSSFERQLHLMDGADQRIDEHMAQVVTRVDDLAANTVRHPLDTSRSHGADTNVLLLLPPPSPQTLRVLRVRIKTIHEAAEVAEATGFDLRVEGELLPV